MFSAKGQNRILLNMGGIANFTYLPADGNASEVFTTDTGPGNTLLDAYARKFLNKPYDEDGQLANQGQVHSELLQALKTNLFFEAPFPKTTGLKSSMSLTLRERRFVAKPTIWCLLT